MKIRIKPVFTFLLAVTVLVTPSCSYFRKSEFTTLTAAEMTSFIEGRLPPMQLRALAQNEAQRKQIITTLKKAFSLAQAGEAEGLQKRDKFKNQMALSIDQMLANEYSKRNQEATISKEETDAYYAAHKDTFEADFKVISEGAKPAPTEADKETFKPRWGEIKLRAEKARQAGVEKEPGFALQTKFNKANLLAGLYSEFLTDKFKLSPEEKKKYLSEHPEADLDKIKEKAQGLLDRLKKGEKFEEIADQNNDDGTKGQGGDLDWFAKGKMDPEFEKAAFGLEKGQVSSELVKTSFGFHIVRVDDKRMAKQPEAPKIPGVTTPAPAAQQNGAPQEEIHARHIYVSTREAESFEQRAIDEKLKRALEDAELKFPVNAPTDFQVKVAGFDPNRNLPGMGGGQVNPNEKK